MDLAPGVFVGDYELLELAGAGGFSVVWKARKPPATALFAVKVPIVEALVDHLRRDAGFTRAVDDRLVVTPLEVHLDADPPHVVYPWIEGAPLAVTGKPPAPEAQADVLALFARLSGIVARLHERGIVHGDLKPGNVLVGKDGVPRLLDLGLARVQQAVRLERSLAQSVVSVDGRSIAGTLDFLAPELFLGKEPSPASDVYSLGVILHEMLTGRPPAFGVSPESLNPYLPPGLEDLLRAMLHHDPERRLQTAAGITPVVEEFVRAEERCKERRNGHERRRVFRERMKTVRRGAKALATGLALGTLGVGTIAWGAAANPGADGGFVQAVFVLASAFGGVFLMFVPLLLGITTINAWILGVPEKTYKNRTGHPLWSFMMQ